MFRAQVVNLPLNLRHFVGRYLDDIALASHRGKLLADVLQSIVQLCDDACVAHVGRERLFKTLFDAGQFGCGFLV